MSDNNISFVRGLVHLNKRTTRQFDGKYMSIGTSKSSISLRMFHLRLTNSREADQLQCISLDFNRVEAERVVKILSDYLKEYPSDDK